MNLATLSVEELEALLEACEMGETTLPLDFEVEVIECSGGVETNFLDGIA